MQNQFGRARAMFKKGQSKLLTAGVLSTVASVPAFAIDTDTAAALTTLASEPATYTPYIITIVVAVLTVSATVGWAKKFGNKAVS